jgi:hypothetical protein
MSRKGEPRSPRVRTSIAAVLVDEDGGEMPVEVVDLSSGGFRLRAAEPLEAGERFRLRVSRYGDFAAQIQWVRDGEAGGRFLEPITL